MHTILKLDLYLLGAPTRVATVAYMAITMPIARIKTLIQNTFFGLNIFRVFASTPVTNMNLCSQYPSCACAPGISSCAELMGGACCGYPNIQIKIKTYIYGQSYKIWWTFKRSTSELAIERELSVLMCLKTPNKVIVRTLF